MFLIKLKTIGNCIITDLENFTIYHGNNTIIDLEEYFDEEKIKLSLKPGGDLRQMMDSVPPIIVKVRADSVEYKKQIRENARAKIKKQTETNRITIKDTLKSLKKMKIADCIEKLDNEFFDNLSILDRVINDKEFPEGARKKARELMGENLNNKLDDKFRLI